MGSSGGKIEGEIAGGVFGDTNLLLDVYFTDIFCECNTVIDGFELAGYFFIFLDLFF